MPKPKLDIRAIKYWYLEKGMSSNEIDREFYKRGISTSNETILNYLKRAGVKIRPASWYYERDRIRNSKRRPRLKPKQTIQKDEFQDIDFSDIEEQRMRLLLYLWLILKKKKKGNRGKTYLLVKSPLGHPRANNGRIFEHILIWEKAHNQPLPDGWVIHHINGNKQDNRSENLKAMPRDKHHPQLWPKFLQSKIRDLEVVNRKLRFTIQELTPKLI